VACQRHYSSVPDDVLLLLVPDVLPYRPGDGPGQVDRPLSSDEPHRLSVKRHPELTPHCLAKNVTGQVPRRSWGIATESAAAAAPEQSDTAIVVRRLGEHWRQGEQRAIHRRPYVRRRAVTARPSMLDPHIPSIEEWLATAPHLSAVDILVRLGEYAPDRFGKRQCVRCNGWSRSGERKQLTSSSPALKSRSGSSHRLSPPSPNRPQAARSLQRYLWARSLAACSA
jgi:hypothetical protein